MTKTYTRFLTAFFCLFLGGFLVLHLALPDRDKSETENRTLTRFPEFTWEGLKDGSYTEIPSYKLPAGFIKGTTGAGDAFCAGALLAIYLGKSDEQILSIASRAAVGALSAADAVSGMKSLSELEALCASMPLQSI